jgi:uncharacterized protein involved in exopolysaccharide biosynthesis
VAVEGRTDRGVVEDEIDLREAAAALWRGRRLIAVLTLLAVVAAGVYGLLAPKQYESAVTVQVSDRSDPIYASPAAAARAVRTLPFLEAVIRASGAAVQPQAMQARIKAEPVRGAPLVRVRVRAGDPGEARRLAGAVAEVFLAEAAGQIVERRRAAEEDLAVVLAQLAEIRRALASNPPEPGIPLDSLRMAYGSLIVARSDLTDLLLELQPPKLVEKPTLPGAPAAPRTGVNVALAAVLGMLVGGMLVGVVGAVGAGLRARRP